MFAFLQRTAFIALLIAWFSGLASISEAQLRTESLRPGVQGIIPMGPLDEMEDMLSAGDAGQKVDLLMRLGVEPEIAKVTVEELVPGERIQLRSVREPGHPQFGAAYLPGFRGCFLYLLEEFHNGDGKPAWRATDHRTVDCWDGDASLEVMTLRRADSDDLVFHHVNVGHGSGYLEDQTQVFAILGGKLVKVLETTDLLSVEEVGTGRTTEHRSTFLRFPGRLYEETRTTSVDDVPKTVERRYWRWSPREDKFVAGTFVSTLAPH